MDEKTEQILTTLAIKLGTTIEHLWGVLGKQAVVTGYVNLILYALAFVLCAFVMVICWRMGKKADDAFFVEYNRDVPDVHSERETRREMLDRLGERGKTFFSAFMTFSLIMVAVVLCFFIFLGDNIGRILNPEYWALRQIMDLF